MTIATKAIMFRKGKTITLTKPVTAWRLVLDESDYSVVESKKVRLKPGKFRVLGTNKKAKMVTIGFGESIKRVWNVPFATLLSATKRKRKTESKVKARLRKAARRNKLGSVVFLGESKDGKTALVCERGSVIMSKGGRVRIVKPKAKVIKEDQAPTQREDEGPMSVEEALDYGAAVVRAMNNRKDPRSLKFERKERKAQQEREESIVPGFGFEEAHIDPELEAAAERVASMVAPGAIPTLPPPVVSEAENEGDPMSKGNAPGSASAASAKLKQAGYDLNLSDEEWDQVKKMIDQGTTPQLVAKRLGIPVGAVKALIGADPLSAES